MDMRFGTWNVRSLYRAGILMTVLKELARYKIDLVSDRMSYIILRGRWCHIIVLNVHAPTEDETDNLKGSFYEELERMFDKFPK
jgi:hypothetical protein